MRRSLWRRHGKGKRDFKSEHKRNPAWPWTIVLIFTEEEAAAASWHGFTGTSAPLAHSGYIISIVSQDLTWLNLDRILTFRSLLVSKCKHLVRGKEQVLGKVFIEGHSENQTFCLGRKKSMGTLFWLRIATNHAVDTFEDSMFHFLHTVPAFYHHIIPGLCGSGAWASGLCLKQKFLNFLLTVLRWNNLAVFLFPDFCSTRF